MKVLVSFLTLFAVTVCVVQAQEDKDKNKLDRKSLSEMKVFGQDSIPHFMLYDSLYNFKITPVPIPNVLNRKDVYDRMYMPMVRPSGKGLSPMPGTENLDKSPIKDTTLKPIIRKK